MRGFLYKQVSLKVVVDYYLMSSLNAQSEL